MGVNIEKRRFLLTELEQCLVQDNMLEHISMVACMENMAVTEHSNPRYDMAILAQEISQTSQ